jgi:DNA-binding transcriptional regulator YiaG
MNDFREARLRLGLSQGQASSLLGVDRDTLGKWERCERRPNAAARRLIDVLGWLQAEHPEIFERVVKRFASGG